MEKLKINFAHFWPHFDVEDNIFVKIIGLRYQVEISDVPDLLIYTNDNEGTKEYLNYNCFRLFVNLENEKTDYTGCDYAIDSFYNNRKNHLRFPLFAFWDLNKLTTPKNIEGIIAEKKKDCCIVVSNSHAKERIRFFKMLNEKIEVDSGGRWMNNVGGPVRDKMEFIKDYKFVISFENSSAPGYTTEKLIEPMLVNSIPIYWGNPRIGEDFNTASFINIKNYKNIRDSIDDILRILNNESDYRTVVSEPWFPNNKVPSIYSNQTLSRFLFYMLEDIKARKPVAKTYKIGVHLIRNKIKNIGTVIKNTMGLNYR